MSKIKIMALGGLGENGKNMYVIEVDDRIFIMDAGMKYPDIDMYGVDAVIPAMDYLKANKDRIEGVFLSHAHEDHIGALPYLLKHLPTRVYGSHFTISIVENILTENNMDISQFKLFRINSSKIMKFGSVSISFFNTTHSIPESLGICLQTHDGNIVYCTDFNFCSLSENIYQTTFDKITDIGKHRVLALLSESINAGGIGRIRNDTVLEYKMKSIFAEEKGRIIVACYSTDLSRIQKVIDLSISEGKNIAIIGRKSEQILDVAVKSNYLKIPEGRLVNLNFIEEEHEEIDNNLVIIVTGYRNEPYQAIIRMAIQEDRLVHIHKDDKVIFMCPAVPGIEKQATDAINTLYEKDVNLTIFDKTILRSAHASPDDLKLIYSMLHPKYIVPIKGEYRHMYEQKMVAKDVGYDDEHVVNLDNGQILSFTDGIKDENVDTIHVGDIFIDGSQTGVVDEAIIKERESLCEEGVLFVFGAIDLRKRAIVKDITFSTRAFSFTMSDEELGNSLSGLVEKMINNALRKSTWDLEALKLSIKEELQKLVFKYTRHRPVILPIIIEK